MLIMLNYTISPLADEPKKHKGSSGSSGTKVMNRIKKRTFLHLSTIFQWPHKMFFSISLQVYIYIYINLCVHTHRDYYNIGSTKGMKISQKYFKMRPQKKRKFSSLRCHFYWVWSSRFKRHITRQYMEIFEGWWKEKAKFCLEGLQT